MSVEVVCKLQGNPMVRNHGRLRHERCERCSRLVFLVAGMWLHCDPPFDHPGVIGGV